MNILLAKPLLFDIKNRLLFFPPRKKIDTGMQASYSPPIGLLYVAQSLLDEGHKVEVIDFYCEDAPEQKLKNSLASVDAVGLSVFSRHYTDSAYIAQTIKEAKPDMPIILGGPHCTFHPDKILHDIPSADISVIGDGEKAIKDVIKTLEGTKELSDIPGVTYKKNSEIKKGKPPQLIKDLDSLSFPARHLIDKYEYGKVNNLYFHRPKFTSIVISRGCPFHCRFCTRDFITIKEYRKRSVENVVKEFQILNEKYGSVSIVDDNFLADVKHVERIMNRLIELGIDLDLYVQGARVDTSNRSLYKKMKKAGVKHIFYGIESGSQEILDFYNKNITLDQISNALSLANEMDFFTIGSFIFGAPIETEKHINETIKFACSLPLDITLWRQLEYKCGSELWYEAVKSGKITKDDDYDIVADSRKGLGNFTKEELEAFSKKAFRNFYFRPSYLVRELFKMFKKRDLTFLKVAYQYL